MTTPKLGWRRFVRFRLWHFLLAVAVIAACLAWFGPRWVRDWERRQEEERIYQEQVALAQQRPAVETAAARLGGSVAWFPHMPPAGLIRRRGLAAMGVFNTRAIVQLQFYPPARPGPSAEQWTAHLPTVLAYPELETLWLRDPGIDAETFEALPGSDALEAIEMVDGTLPLEGFEWCGRCPNLRYFNYSTDWKSQAQGVPDAACVRALAQCELLETVYLDMLDASGDALAPLVKLPHLHTLHVSTKEPLDVAVVESLAVLRLKRLSLIGTPITAAHADALSKAETLEELVISAVDEPTLQHLRGQLPGATVRKHGPFGFPSERWGYSKIRKRN